MEKFVKYIVVILIVLGLLFMMSKSTKEGFMNPNRCPNILIQKGQEFYLYNSRMAKVPGVNPLRFNSLEDYTEFINFQQSLQSSKRKTLKKNLAFLLPSEFVPPSTC